MSLFLILLAAGEGKRLKTKTPKPFNLIRGKTLLEHSLDTFKNISEITKVVIVFNKKHTWCIRNIDNIYYLIDSMKNTINAINLKNYLNNKNYSFIIIKKIM